jgi:hypothetical protein
VGIRAGRSERKAPTSAALGWPACRKKASFADHAALLPRTMGVLPTLRRRVANQRQANSLPHIAGIAARRAAKKAVHTGWDSE